VRHRLPAQDAARQQGGFEACSYGFELVSCGAGHKRWNSESIYTHKTGGLAVHSPTSAMGVMAAREVFGLFLDPELPLRCFLWACLRFSFSLTRSLKASRCMLRRSRCISRSSASVICGDLDVDMELPALETLRASSSKGSDGKRSSSERYDEARTSQSESDESEALRGHDGKAQAAS
jgi:hypothetical protein